MKGTKDMFKKIISLALVLCCTLSSVSAHDFTDAKGHWAESEIEYGFENKIVQGYSDGLFKPDNQITRAEFTKMLIASLCTNLEIDSSTYADGTHWASQYYNFAVNERLFMFLPESTFDGVSPAILEGESYDYPIKRWEMAFMLYCVIANVFGAQPADVDYNDKQATLTAYDENIDYVISSCISWELLKGDENGNFNASKNGTRAEALTIVNRVDRMTKEIIQEMVQIQEEDKLVNDKVKTYEEIPEGKPKVKVEMNNGKSFIIELYPEYAPQTVANFVALVEEGFYDGLKFHRVVEGFMAQGGDPDGDGSGGSEHNIIGEFAANGFDKNTLKHERGVISMARAKHMNSASSQFFICFDAASFLDGNYAAFGKVIEGMEVVDAFLEIERDVNVSGEVASPKEDIIMKKVTVIK